MICITGDLHHMSLRTNEQRWLAGSQTEVRTGLRYLEIASRYDVKVTLFFTGKAFQEEWADIKEFLKFPNFEVGGHTFSAFSPKLLHRAYKKLFGTFNGPPPIQHRDIRRTVEVIYRLTGRRVRSWRDHAYFRDRHTPALLHQQGLEVLSDAVDPTMPGPVSLDNGLVELPINVMPDHEHLLHAHRTETLQRRIHERFGWCDAFGWQAYSPQRWLEQVMTQADSIDMKGGVATVLMHPLCMYTADGFSSFEAFCRFAAGRHTIFASEAASLVESQRRSVYA